MYIDLNTAIDRTPYRLAQAMHHCAVKFPDVAGTVIHLLMDFLSNSNAASALDVIVFVREILETNPKLHDTVLERLFDNFGQIQSLRVCSCALWIFGEYCTTKAEIDAALNVIREALGPLPLFVEGEEEEGALEEGATPKAAPAPQVKARPAVLADGSYATQIAYVEAPIAGVGGASQPNMRMLLLAGEFFVGAVMSATLTKLLLRLRDLVKVRVSRDGMLGG